MQLFAIIATLVALVSVVFALQNNVPVTVTFLLWRFDSSLALVLLFALAIGMLIIGLASTPATLRRQWTIVKLSKRVSELEKASDKQKATITDLEGRVPPPEPAPEPAAIEERPYVGLREIIAGKGAKEDTEEPPRPV